MRLRTFVALLSIMSAGVTIPGIAQATIDTRPGALFDDASPVGQFSYNTTATSTYQYVVGQTFRTAGGYSYLNNFSFFLNNYFDATAFHSQSLTFRAFVMRWDEGISRPMGPILFQSGPTIGTASDVFGEYLFSPANLNLLAGVQYVAFLSSFMDRTPGFSQDYVLNGVQSVYNDVSNYSDGALVIGTADNQSGSLTDFLSANNSTFIEFSGTPSDAAFRATFGDNVSTVVPEPTTVLSFGFGLILIASVRVGSRRRRRRNMSF